ncbi:MAG: hypothetical protein LPK09_04445 [Hymenobacteraceae bacterium]|nr:hypothetical protein [Hymenobacteraceae bacterium]
MRILYISAFLLSPILIACNGQKDIDSPATPEVTERQILAADIAKAETVGQVAKNSPQPALRGHDTNPPQTMAGTWRSEEDDNWKLVFTDEGICYQYYQEDLLETDTYTVSNTSPQCDQEVPVDSHTSYLQLENMETNESTCYEINGITANTLSLRPLTMGGVVVFKKQ